MLAGLGGSVAVYVFDFHTNSLTAGASGAIYGLVGAYFIILKRLKLDTSAMMPYLIFLILYSVLFSHQVSLAGHLGGLFFGAGVAAGLAYPPQKLRTPLQVATVAGTTVILILITLVWTLVNS